MGKTYRSEALGAIYEAASDLHEAGVMDKATLRKFDALCLMSGGHPRPGERLTPTSARATVAKRVAAGVEGRITGHSPRVEAAQSLASRGASLVEMQQAGRWDSPNMPGRYARGELAKQDAVARLRK